MKPLDQIACRANKAELAAKSFEELWAMFGQYIKEAADQYPSYRIYRRHRVNPKPDNWPKHWGTFGGHEWDEWTLSVSTDRWISFDSGNTVADALRDFFHRIWLVNFDRLDTPTDK